MKGQKDTNVREYAVRGVTCAEGQASSDCLGDLESATLPPDTGNGNVPIRTKVDWTTRAVWNMILPGENEEPDLKMMYWTDSDGNQGPEGQLPSVGVDVYIPLGE